jgi:hypothetical protein
MKKEYKDVWKVKYMGDEKCIENFGNKTLNKEAT